LIATGRRFVLADYKGGEYKGLVYTIAHPKPANLKIPQTERVNARVKAVSWLVNAFDKWGMKVATQRHIDPLRPEIKAGVDDGQVVLVVLQLTQWEQKNGAGHLQQMLHYAYIGAIAFTRHLAYIKHKDNQHLPLLKPAPPRGWVYGPQVYLWFESEEKRKTQSMYDHGNLNWDVVI